MKMKKLIGMLIISSTMMLAACGSNPNQGRAVAEVVTEEAEVEAEAETEAETEVEAEEITAEADVVEDESDFPDVPEMILTGSTYFWSLHDYPQMREDMVTTYNSLQGEFGEYPALCIVETLVSDTLYNQDKMLTGEKAAKLHLDLRNIETYKENARKNFNIDNNEDI